MEQYSQNNEDLIIENFFKSYTGRYLDIGAYDGTSGSNTFQLLKKGWAGVVVEASPEAFSRLTHNYRDFDKVTMVNKALVPNYWTKELPFYEPMRLVDGKLYATSVSSFSLSHAKWFLARLSKHDITLETRTVETVRVNDFFNQHGYDFDFISLDVEQLNFELITAMPWEKFTNLKLISVEIDVSEFKLTSFFEHFDFHLVTTMGANMFLAKN